MPRAALACLALIFSASGCSIAAPASSAGPHSPPQPAPQVAQKGQSVRDGQFSFKVEKVRAGVRRIRGELTGETHTAGAVRQYVVVTLTVTNHGTRPEYVSSDEQLLLAGGKTYSADNAPTIALDGGDEIGLPEEINPDDLEKITVVYKLTAGAKPAAVEVHETAESAGLLVSVS